ncbi:MAG: hypothetical protein M0P31_14940 [Solirubrobacteraceae bacterium]|nr:hypothetical protein [Solirubrobacteraceae bacterium]
MAPPVAAGAPWAAPGPDGDTLVVSDLHLGSATGSDLLRRSTDALDGLLDGLDGVGRLVIAGDLLELRHGPARAILDRARPVLRAIGERLGPDRRVLVLAGNHDHAIVRPWIDRRRLAGEALAPTDAADPVDVSPLAVAIADALAPAAVHVAYPAAWIVAPDRGASGGPAGVLVTHGHHQDAIWRLPTVERLLAGAVARAHRQTQADTHTVEQFERLLRPAYGWIEGMAEYAERDGQARSQRTSARVWELLRDGRGVRGRAARIAVPVAVRAARRGGLGDLEPRLDPDVLRREGLAGVATVVRRWGLRPAHLVSGHTHHAGPLADAAPHEWRTAAGIRLWNPGAWVWDGTSPSGAVDGRAHPYAPGGAIRIGVDGEPRVVRLLP